MPTAGDEGSDEYVTCPYDKAHEIRRGRLQFHLKKCRQNFPSASFVKCPFNATHIIPATEIEFHIENDCDSRANFDNTLYDVGDSACSVAGLVPVNAGTLPASEESWDACNYKGSVLDNIRQEAEQKPILRIKQCVSKAQRKAFRREEQVRMQRINREGRSSVASTPAPSVVSVAPLRRPQKPVGIPVKTQDPQEAMAAISSGMNKMSINPMKNTEDYDNKSDCRSYTTAASNFDSLLDEPSTSAYSYATASKRADLPHTSANTSRPSTAMSIESSVSRLRNMAPPSADGFCPIPIPGLGRGRRPKIN